MSVVFRRIAIVVVLILASYVYGVTSHKFGLFPFHQLKNIKDAIYLSISPIERARGFKDTRGRQIVSCNMFSRSHTAVIVIAGQSTADNSGDKPYSPSKPVHNFNLFDGKCYRAQDPLLGTTGSGGSVWSRLGDILVEDNTFHQILFVPLAVGGSSVKHWIKSDGLYRGPNFRRFTSARRRLRELGLKISHIIWQQGETDAVLGMTEDRYAFYLGQLIETLRVEGIPAPIYITQTTYCQYKRFENIRRAQRTIIEKYMDVFAGADTDKYSAPAYRYDGCHLSGEGLDALARSWFQVLAK